MPFVYAMPDGGGGGGGTQRDPDPVQDTKDVNFATLSKRKCSNFLPCSRLDQAGPIQNTKKVHKSLRFHALSTKVHEISENYVI